MNKKLCHMISKVAAELVLLKAGRTSKAEAEISQNSAFILFVFIHQSVTLTDMLLRAQCVSPVTTPTHEKVAACHWGSFHGCICETQAGG